MWFTFSLLSIIAWGCADLFAKRGTDPRDRYSHYRLVIAVGAVMGVHALGSWLLGGIDYSPRLIVVYFPVSFCYILSMTIGYAGLRFIELSVSSPICNSSGAVSALLCFLLLGQRMEPLQFAGVAMISVGIFLLSLLQKRAYDAELEQSGEAVPGKYRYGLLAILFPILYCLVDGLGTFLDAYYLEHIMGEAQANISYELTFALCALLSWLYLRFYRRQSASLFQRRDYILAAICEAAGQFTYVYAMSDAAILAAPMIASYSIFSVLLSRIFLKEKLTRTQYLVITLVMCGIAVLGFFDI